MINANDFLQEVNGRRRTLAAAQLPQLQGFWFWIDHEKEMHADYAVFFVVSSSYSQKNVFELHQLYTLYYTVAKFVKAGKTRNQRNVHCFCR